MKKVVFSLSLFVMVSFISAQTININKTYQLIDKSAHHPTFNQDGSMLAFTAASYVGLSLYDFNTKTIVKVTDDEGAGLAPTFSDDGQRVFYTNVEYINKLRHEGLRSYDIAKGSKTEMLKTERRTVDYVQSFHNGVVMLAENKVLKSTFGKTEQTIADYAWSDGVNLNVIKDGKKAVINPIAEAHAYIWASVSPNGKMIMFTAPSYGTFVCDFNGNILRELGYLNAPVWYDDNFVVGMIDKDDGDIITESKIIIRSLNGHVEQTLSPSNQIAMYPAASAVSGKIAYSTYPGAIYIVELTIR